MHQNYSISGQKQKRSIIILSEFQEGTWDSVCFSLNKLASPDHVLILVQTYENPHVGQSLLNNISPLLERIAQNELIEIKKKALEKKILQTQQMEIYTFEGDISAFVRYRQGSLNSDCMVVGIRHSFPENIPGLLARICKLARIVTKPLFILPQQAVRQTFRQILYLSDEKQNLSETTDFLQYFPFDNHVHIDFRWMSCLDEERQANFAWEKVCTLFGEAQIKERNIDIAPVKMKPEKLTEDLSPEMVIIDQSLLMPCTRLKQLKLTSWLEAHPDVPFLIVKTC